MAQRLAWRCSALADRHLPHRRLRRRDRPVRMGDRFVHRAPRVPQGHPRGAKTYVHELPLYWRVPWAAWTVLIAAPLIAAWAIVQGEWDPLGVIFLALLWLLYFVLLRWHSRAKAHHPDRPPGTRGLE
jgi:hypothetical protein